MAFKDQTIENKCTGEKVRFLEVSKDTHGKLLRFELTVKPGGFVVVNHIHPNQDEFFKIHKGCLKVKMKDETFYLNKDEELVIPKGTPHQWWNDTEEDVCIDVQFKPALKMEIFLEQFFGLSNDDKTKADGTPSFMQIMAMSNEYEIYVTGPPIPLQRAMSFVLGGLARLFGYKNYYEKYSRF